MFENCVFDWSHYTLLADDTNEAAIHLGLTEFQKLGEDTKHFLNEFSSNFRIFHDYRRRNAANIAWIRLTDPIRLANNTMRVVKLPKYCGRSDSKGKKTIKALLHRYCNEC